MPEFFYEFLSVSDVMFVMSLIVKLILFLFYLQSIICIRYFALYIAYFRQIFRRYSGLCQVNANKKTVESMNAQKLYRA